MKSRGLGLRGAGGWRLVALLAVLAVVCALKSYYRHASAEELAWILTPTSWLVSLVTGNPFSFEAGAGWVSHDARFIIAPGCAGINFLLAALLTLAVVWLPDISSPRSAAGRVLGALAAALASTLVVNTARIAIAVAHHRGAISMPGLDADQAHRALSTAVFLGGLLALYFIARVRRGHATGHCVPA